MNKELKDFAAVDPRTKWGRVKFGAQKTPAMAVAIPVGLVIAFGFALLAVWADVAGPHLIVGLAAFTFALSAPCIATIYALVVDRSTMLGAPDDPDESIESRWYERAAAGSFMDVLVGAGLAAGLASVLDWHMDGVLVLMGIWALGLSSLGLRYFLIRRRG